MESDRRILELDAIRGLASLAIVIFHYTTRYEDLFGHIKEPYLDFSYGSLAVHLFFIMSGFVIFMTLNKIKDLKKYFKTRIIRLYPAYIIAVVVIFITVSIYGLEGRMISLWEAVLNLTMFQGHIPGVSHVDGAFWTLTREVTFFITIGILHYLGFTKNIVFLSISWLSLSSIIIIISDYFDSSIINYIRFLSLSDYIHLFIAGIIFYHIRINKKNSYYLLILACLFYEYAFNHDYMDNIANSLFFVLLYLMINDKLKFLGIKPLVFLGSISYSVYLLHQNLGYIIINILERNGFVHEIYLMIPLSIIIIFATIITYYVEKPIQKWFKIKRQSIPNITKES